jgi:hypothetical protein
MSNIQKWLSTDNIENYKSLNFKKNNYTQDEILYEFNSTGYRCDEFSTISEFPVIFMGCSFTEGIGLPLNEIWSYYLHNKIVEVTNKTIPFWSLAKNATSIDYVARCFYEQSTQLKPKYIFHLMSGITRREYSFESSKLNNWYPNATPSSKSLANDQLVSQIFSDPNFAIYQTYRSAMILNSTAQAHGTKIFIFGLPMDAGISQQQKIDLFSKFNNIEYIPVTISEMDNIDDSMIPDRIKNRPIKARDGIHPGAIWQYKLYNFIWENVKNKISF